MSDSFQQQERRLQMLDKQLSDTNVEFRKSAQTGAQILTEKSRDIESLSSLLKERELDFNS